jgi:hypothetical protein
MRQEPQAPSSRQERGGVLWWRQSRPLALEITGRDFDRALDDTAVPIDAFLERTETFGELGYCFRFAVGFGSSRAACRVCRDDGDFLAQVIGHLVHRIGLQRMELFQEAEEQQP